MMGKISSRLWSGQSHHLTYSHLPLNLRPIFMLSDSCSAFSDYERIEGLDNYERAGVDDTRYAGMVSLFITAHGT